MKIEYPGNQNEFEIDNDQYYLGIEGVDSYILYFAHNNPLRNGYYFSLETIKETAFQ
ncbi:MAG: hypothetical protein ABI266_06395 [Ginsengibacter sp.]